MIDRHRHSALRFGARFPARAVLVLGSERSGLSPAVQQRCTPNPNAIPWLLLSAVADGPGVFHRVAFIQRVNTVGGNAPSSPGSVVGAEARVPYTTEYFFYRAP